MNSQSRVCVALCLLLSACTGEAPSAPEPLAATNFIGSEACGTCHEQEYRDWRDSHHELAMQVADESTVLGNFDNASFDYFGTSTRFSKRGSEYFVNTENENGELQDYRVTHTFGVTPCAIQTCFILAEG